ncbi:MAG: spermidine/putrescine ABC transporter substrate-binding protein [Synechococcales cyanobacterium C42_A2020_086]|jgi:spermidine/putrescine transport system substrate-binding protein|nr:spermidine/putrescine ABC transporter substrate-binding protein [Synechococcales cyanobacterium C42_A2020_086]
MNSRKSQSQVGKRLKRYPNRRRFLQFSAAAISTVALSNCARNLSGGQTATESDNTATYTAVDNQTLYLYTWADYSNDALFQRFTAQTGIKVVADVFDSNETMLAKLQAGGGNQYSVIYPSDYMVRQMIDSNLLTRLDSTKIKGTENLMPRWESPVYDPDAAYSVPFNWGTTGLIYNTDVITSQPDDWDFLWENAEPLSGKITLLDDVRETMGMVLKSLGYSYNATDPAQIEAAYQRLRELRPAIAAFKTYGWEDQLIAGDLAICMTYSTLGLALPETNSQLRYFIPKSGTSIWTDTMAIPVGAPNPEAAYAWINFNLEPETAAFAATEIKLGTPNKAAFELLPAEVKSNPKQYPPEDLVKNFEGIAPVGDALALYDRYWTQVRA